MSKTPKSEQETAIPLMRTNSLPYAASRLGPGMELVDIAKEISQANAMVNTRVSAKLRVIADQIRHLQQEARDILEETQRDQQLHQAGCNFKRIPGKTYHLYQNNNNRQYFSMLAPADWGDHPPHKFLGSYRLENDMSWTPLDATSKPEADDSRELVERLLNSD